MKLILYQATIAITEIDFVPGPFRCWIELGHIDFAVDILRRSLCAVARSGSEKGLVQNQFQRLRALQR